MKKITCFVLSVFCVYVAINAQLSTNQTSVKATQIGETLNGIDEAIFFDGIIPNITSITFTYSYTNPTTIKWYRYLTTASPTAPYELLSEYASSSTLVLPSISTPGYNISVENGDKCGYIIQYEDGMDTKYLYIWVFDLKNVNIIFNSFIANNDGVDPCFSTHLLANLSYPNLEYYSSAGAKNTIPRKFYLSYNSLDSLNNNTTINIEKTNLISGDNNMIVSAPYKTTKFTLEGDQFFKAINAPVRLSTADYTPVAVMSNLKAVVAERNSLNEIDRTRGALGGSAPLVVDFTSNSNVPIAQYFEWYIKKTTDSTDVVYYTDKNLRYTFEESGLYNIKLRVSNPTCIVSDSIDATVVESFMEVPNVFTPNGDGKNDEFRVAFKSIVQFRGLVYNRWGRKVYEWTDPGKGWDGRIGNKMAQPGAYYYIIEAIGSDIDPLTNKPMTYIFKGDINLIRGK